MTLVVNSGPLISLARIDHLGLLPDLFDAIVSPRAVFNEVTLDPKLPGAEAIANASWLRTMDVSDRKAVAPLLDQLRARGIHLSPRLYDDARRSAGEL